MNNELAFIAIDPEPERALEIVVHYLERKYGALDHSAVERAVHEIYALFRKDIRHPLLLANRAISAIENPRRELKTA
jgi:hypothetical protein